MMKLKYYFKKVFQPKLKQSLILLILLFCFSLSVPLLAQDQSKDVFQLVEQGKKLYNAGQFTEAIPIWLKASDSFAEEKNSLNQAMTLSNLSLTYQQLGEWEKANTAISQSLKLLESLEKTTEQQRILAQTLDIQGQFSQKTGQTQVALNTWAKAFQLYQKLADENSLILNQINQAQAMQDLGLYPRACQTLLETLGLEQRECNITESEITSIKQDLLTTSPNNIQQAQLKSLRSLGNVLRVIGDFQQSENILQASLEIAQHWNLSQDETKTLLNLANTERAIASRATEIDDIEQAEIYREKALTHYQKVSAKASSILQFQAKLNQLELLMNQEKWENAEILSEQMSTLLATLPQNRDGIYAKINYARNSFCLKQKNYFCLNPQNNDTALINDSSYLETSQLLQIARENAATLQDLRTQSYAVGLLGRLAENSQQWEQAYQYTKEALYDSWQAQAPELTYQWQWQLGRILKAQGKNQEALSMYAQAVQTLKSLRSDLVSINPEIQFTFRESIEPIYREYVDLLLQPREQQVSLENLQIALNTIDSLQLAELENFFRLVCLDANPVLIDQVTDKNDPTAAVVYPILLEDRFEIILKLPQQPLRHYTTPINNKKEVERIINRLALSLTQANSQETLPLAQKVYEWLLRPAQEDLANSQVKTLVFVLDSALRNIPMSVLYDGEHYLVEKYSIALVPGLQLLDPQPFRQNKPKALIAGLSEARGRFPPLPFVPQELKEIQAQVASNVELLNQQFTNESFKDLVNSAPFSVVHLATHGQFSSQADETFILTWDDRIDVNQLNNLLRSRDQQNSSIELLVLSACETLTGDKRASLGLAGVAVRAGARSTLATLWQVNDQTTAIFMNQFYAALKDSNVTKAEALQIAQRKLLNDPTYQRPHFWAAYVLVGNWL